MTVTPGGENITTVVIPWGTIALAKIYHLHDCKGQPEQKYVYGICTLKLK